MTARRVLAFGQLFLLVVLLAMGARPAWHEEVHCDAHEGDHVCAITLFAHGHIEAGDGFVPIITLGAPFEFSVFPGFAPVFAKGVAFLQPARGPPLPA